MRAIAIPESSVVRPRVHERLQRPRLLESALGAQAITAAQRLSQRRDRRIQRAVHGDAGLGLVALQRPRDERGHQEGGDPAHDAVDQPEEG